MHPKAVRQVSVSRVRRTETGGKGNGTIGASIISVWPSAPLSPYAPRPDSRADSY